MKSIGTALAVCVMLIFSGTNSRAASLTLTLNADWDITITLSSDGDKSITREVGTYNDNGYPTAMFQSQGAATILIEPTYNGPLSGTPYMTAAPYEISLLLTPGEENENATGSIVSEAFYGATSKDSGYGQHWWILIDVCLMDDFGEVISSTEISRYVGFYITQFRHIWAELGSGGFSGVIGAYDISYVPGSDGFDMIKTPVVGEHFELTADEPFSITPPYSTTSAYGDWGKAEFFIKCPLSAFAGGLMNGTIHVSDGSRPPISRTVGIPFALAVEWSDFNSVELKNQLTGEWAPMSGDALYRGDWIRLTPVPVASSILYPSITVQFADGQLREFALENGYDPDKAGETIVTVGEDELEGENVCWTVKFTNFSQDMALNHKDYAREIIWNGAISLSLNAIAPGSNWLLRFGTKTVIKYALDRLGFTSRYQPPSKNAVQDDAGGVTRAVDADAIGGAVTGDVSFTLNGAGGFTAQSRNGLTTISDSNGLSRQMPPRTQLTRSLSAFGPVSPLPYPSPTPIGQLAMTPSDGDSVDSLTPLITITYDGYGSAYMAQTLECRINGDLVESFSGQTNSLATYQIPNSAPLRNGYNDIEVAIIEANSGRQTLSARIYATGSIKAPANLLGLSGASSMLLFWDPSSDQDLEGYHVYKGETAGALTERLTTSPIRGSAYAVYAAQDPGLAAGAWYAVSTVASGRESALSQPVQGKLGALNGPAPGQASDLSATAEFGAARIDFTPESGAWVYQLSRPGADPLLFRSPPFIDAPLVNGDTYVYTLTPLGADLVAGPTSEASVTLPSAAIPPEPEGVVAYSTSDSGKNWTIRWDPSKESGVSGYNVYQSKDGGNFSKLNAALITDASLAVTPGSPGAYAWLVTAVGSGGGESLSETVVCGGYATPLCITGGVLPLLLLEE